jgi:hypothetical protein
VVLVEDQCRKGEDRHGAVAGLLADGDVSHQERVVDDQEIGATPRAAE